VAWRYLAVPPDRYIVVVDNAEIVQKVLAKFGAFLK